MTIRQGAFTGENRLLKGALHCHTTRSDGRGEPDDVIRLHAKNGYDFMALTDHRVYNFKNYAPDTPMTIVPGMEMDRGIAGDKGVHCFHAVAIGPVEGNGFRQDQTFESGAVADQYAFQPVLDEMHKNGNLTIYCHPEWSTTPAREFENLVGNFAMEIWNTGCVYENDMDKDAAYWDELLIQGKRIFGVATDDGHAMNQHCRGWVMVNAENDVPALLAALERGAFYSSCGPVIRDFYIEDGKAVVECSPANRVRFHYGRYPTIIRRAEGQSVTRAEFDVPEYFRYLRVSVVDEAGRIAWTNPIFLKA